MNNNMLFTLQNETKKMEKTYYNKTNRYKSRFTRNLKGRKLILHDLMY